MTVWLLFGQIKAKAREVGSDTVAGWKLRDDRAEFSQKHLGPLRPISLEILRPDNWMKLYIPILFLSGYFPNCHLLVMILSTGTPGSKDDIPDTYITVHTQCLWVHEVWEGNSLCIPSCRAQAFSDEGCFLRRSLLEFLLGLGANPLPMLRLGKQISPPSSFLFCHHIRPCFYPGLLPFL